VPPQGNEVAQANTHSLALLNQLRGNLGLNALTVDAQMSVFALDWSQEMSASGFRHSSGPWAENIVWYSNDGLTPQQAAASFHDSWVNSPGHYANMTNSRWDFVGIGLYRDGDGWWGTHVFR